MTDEPYYAPGHKPPLPRTSPPGIPLWTLRKGTKTISAEWRHGEHEDVGCELGLSRNGEWFFGRRYLTGGVRG